MIDPKLINLSSFSSHTYVLKKLKRKFFDEFYDYCQTPLSKRNNIKGDTYQTMQPACWDEEGNLLTEAYTIDHTFLGFLENEITKEFELFGQSYYDELKYVRDYDKRMYYSSVLLDQLVKIENQVKNNLEIPITYRDLINIKFKELIKDFKQKFNLDELKKEKKEILIPNAFSYNMNNIEFRNNINLLFSSLINSGLISSDSRVEQFYSIFKNRKIKKRVKWKGTISQFYYFIKRINNHDDFSNLKNNKWKVAVKCFYLPSRDNNGEFEWRKLRSQSNPNSTQMKKIDQYLRL